MVGASTDALGGVSAVLKTILSNWPADARAVRHIASYRDGNGRRKLATAAQGLMRHAVSLSKDEVQVVHVHFSAGASFYRKSLFILLSRMFGVPVIGQAHAGAFPRFHNRLGPLGKWYVRFVLGRLDRLLVLSEEWVAFYADIYRRERIAIIPNPVVIPSRANARPDGPPVILALGRLTEGKGTYDILDAVPDVLAEFPDAQFWLGGDGEIDAVRERIAGEVWGAQVHLLGWVDGAEKEAALRQASIFLLPSYAEGLPMALLEAMARAIPVVTTPVGGIPQVVADGETGLLVTPGDASGIAGALRRLLRDPGEAARIGDAARALVRRRHEVGVVTAQLSAIYNAVADGSARR